MTALIGGALLLIAGSAVTLVLGYIGVDPPLIWTSIIASAVAAILLALGYYRSGDEVAAQAFQSPELGPGEVIAVPDRKRYHRAGCRYAKVSGAEVMAATDARRKGYDACAICKP